MIALENVTQEEFVYLKQREKNILMTAVGTDQSRNASGIPPGGILGYVLGYNPETKKVNLFRSGSRGDASTKDLKDLDLVKDPVPSEGVILEVALQYLERYRTANVYTI